MINLRLLPLSYQKKSLHFAVGVCTPYIFFYRRNMATNILPSDVEKKEEKPWHAAFPKPSSTASLISREELLGLMKEGKIAGKDFVLVDLRRTDFEVR